MVFDPRSIRLMVVSSGTLEPGHGHRRLVSEAARAGATAIQLRAPELDDHELLSLARALAGTCVSNGVLFIVNDRLEVSLSSGANGVHLGQSDKLDGARERLGPDRVLGISVADTDQAVRAVGLGADYLGVTVWSTATKPEAVGVGTRGLREIAEAVDLPVVGIGGIDRSNLGEVFAAGAHGVAVISAVASAPDPASATRDLRELIDRVKGP